MHDAAFAAAARPARIYVLGLEMLPYSIGHELILIQQANALLSDPVFFDTLPVEEKNQAVISAALICCNSWRQNQKPHRLLWLWYLLKVNRAKFQKEIEKFRSYRAAGTTLPPAADPEADSMANGKREMDGRHLGGPFAARLMNFASNFSANEIAVYGDSVFDYPFGLAAWRYVCQLETQDAMRIENAKEFQLRIEMEEHRQWYKEKTGKEAL